MIASTSRSSNSSTSGYSRAAQCAGHEFGLLAIGIRDADQFSAGQTDEYTSMIAAHDTDAHDAHTQWTLCVCCCSLHHEPACPFSHLSPTTTGSGWRPPVEHRTEHVLHQCVAVCDFNGLREVKLPGMTEIDLKRK